MKIYFGFTVAGNRSSIEAARRLIDVVSKMGHEVLTRHLVDDNAWEKDRIITPRAVYLRDMSWLEQCDLFMAEVSGSSFGLGFETGYVLGATKKRVLLFYERKVENNISLLITGNAHPNCRLVPYSEVEEAELWVQSELSQS
jgi:Nucleoside 2-deoxyribosyltransferase